MAVWATQSTAGGEYDGGEVVGIVDEGEGFIPGYAHRRRALFKVFSFLLSRGMFGCKRSCSVVFITVIVLGVFAIVPLGDGADIADDTGIDFGRATTMRALGLLTGEIAMLGTNTESWSECEVG